MAERASHSQDDAEQGYNSSSSDLASINTKLELTVQLPQRSFVMNNDGVKKLLLVPTESSNISDLVSLETVTFALIYIRLATYWEIQSIY